MPIARPDVVATLPGQAVTIAPFANDEGANLALTGFSQPANGVAALGGTAGTLRYTPNAGFTGVDQFTYTVSDATGAAAQATVTVTVSALNRQPDMIADAASVAPGGLVNVQVLANDSDPDGDPLQLASIAMPEHGSITGHPDMSVSYQPEPGYQGIDRFSYTVVDGKGGSGSAEVVITVATLNLQPSAQDDRVMTQPGQPVTVAVLANDRDGNDDPLTLSGVGMPANGTVVVDGAQRLTYTPAAGFVGTDSLTYTVADGRGGAATGRLVIDVQNLNHPPVAVTDTVTTNANTAVTVPVLGNDSDPDGDALQLLSVAMPANGTVAVDAQKRVVYTPKAGFVGLDGFTYKLVDARGAESVGTVAVTVQADPAPQTYGNGYLYRRRIVVPKASLAEGTLADFPLLVELAGAWLKPVAQGGRLQSALAFDLRFEGNSGPRYDHEIERYDAAAGTLRAWVRLPALNAAADSTVYLYYGKPGLTVSEENPAGVWKDYLAVYHLPSGIDRTGKSLDLAATGVTTATLVGEAGGFNGSSSVMTRTQPSFLDGMAAYTVQAWVKAAAIGTDQGIVSVGPVTGRDADMGFCLRYDKDGYSGDGTNVITVEHQLTDGRNRLESSSNVQSTAAQFLAVTWSRGASPQLWIDGRVDQASYANAARTTTTSFSNGPLRIGQGAMDATGGWNGAIDEVRFRAAALPANWLAAEFLNQRLPGAFYGLGGEDAFGATNQAPVAIPNRATAERGTAVTIDVLAGDLDPNGDTLSLTAGSVSTPAHGTAAIAAGKIVYTPAAGYVGEDWFTYAIGDGKGGSSTGTVLVQVTAPAPSSNDDKPYRNRFLGCTVQAEAVGNTRYDYGKPAVFRFRAERTGQVRLLRWVNRVDTGTGSAHVGYSKGTGGTVRIELRTNNPNGNVPSTTVLAKTANLTNLLTRGTYTSAEFLTPYPTLSADEIYHLVFVQLDASGENAVSVNMLHTKMPIPLGGTGRMGPFHGDVLAHLWTSNNGTTWFSRDDRCPIYELEYTDGQTCGQGWLFSHDSADKKVGGSAMARQRFVVLDYSRTAQGIWFRARKQGSPSDLIVQLLEDNVLVEELRVPAAQLVTSTRYDVTVPWQYKPFAQLRTLAKGKVYHLRFSATTGEYWFATNQRGKKFGFGERNMIEGNYAEYSANGGQSWAGWSFTADFLGTASRTDLDLPVAFKLV